MRFLKIKSVPTLFWSAPKPLTVRPPLISLLMLVIGLILFGLGEALKYYNSYIVSNYTAIINDNTYFLFSKNIKVNESGLKGYYANVTFQNHSKKRAELFAVGSEIVISSK